MELRHDRSTLCQDYSDTIRSTENIVITKPPSVRVQSNNDDNPIIGWKGRRINKIPVLKQ